MFSFLTLAFLCSPLPSVTVDQISSVKDLRGTCQKSYPCQHGPIEIVLHNGERVCKRVASPDIYVLLKAMKEAQLEIDEGMWQHFSCYEKIEDQGLDWRFKEAQTILTELFSTPL